MSAAHLMGYAGAFLGVLCVIGYALDGHRLFLHGALVSVLSVAAGLYNQGVMNADIKTAMILALVCLGALYYIELRGSEDGTEDH